ncbi:unnamed protein product (macronuclear) [Paramecium tetraurelia]|uniref:Ubiquitin-like protease family profile domain-containing protein n=1 Tax=Paramecium tetraurelia TaxID=5888 RepID=A0E5W8_PARTE|nr:uncharacterized protein GSPATT00003548001 [Paramecium tetraurelia]CAK90685.1 unnamed protein product [Paramecium tetraurelia]|eukprot:XP_001458082.1 hypothetical protein (macronuclear) [Paramecium tetraurelia strain d4-2]
MNEGYYNDQDKYKDLKNNLDGRIIYIEPQLYLENLREFNERNPTYGVTVDYRFLKTIQQCDFLESSQLQFFINLFRKAYPQVKLAAATCHFFADFIVSLQIPVSQQQLNQTNSTGYQSQKLQESLVQPQQKISEEYIESHVMNKSILDNQQNINISTQSNNSIITNKSNTNDSNLSVQKPTASANNFKGQYAQSQIIPKTTKDNNVDYLSQSLIQNNNIANNKPQSQLFQANRDVQAPQQVQVNQTINPLSQIQIDNQPNQQNSNISDSQSIPYQAPLSGQQNPINVNDQIQSPIGSQIISHQFIDSNVGSINETQEKPQLNQEQFQNAQSIIYPQNNQQVPSAQAQVEQQQAQPPPEKKFFFQITNMTIQKPAQQDNINKSYLPSLIKQLAEMNNLTEEQLKDQDYWYFPINQLQSHWISVVINFKKKEIFYFDSYYKKTDPVILQGINSILEHFKINPQNFQVRPVYNQQINGYDCGVFILLSLLYTLQQKTYNYTQSVATQFRKGVLYNLAVIGAQQDIDQVYLEFIVDQH